MKPNIFKKNIRQYYDYFNPKGSQKKWGAKEFEILLPPSNALTQGD